MVMFTTLHTDRPRLKSLQNFLRSSSLIFGAVLFLLNFLLSIELSDEQWVQFSLGSMSERTLMSPPDLVVRQPKAKLLGECLGDTLSQQTSQTPFPISPRLQLPHRV